MRQIKPRWSRGGHCWNYNFFMLLQTVFEPPFYYVGWFTLALINAGLAQAKNRSGLLWFIISIFFGPLATLVIVLLPRS